MVTDLSDTIQVSPRSAERPHLLAALVRDRLGGAWSARRAQDSSRAREEALAKARSALSSRSSLEREHFEQALSAAERIYRVRDDSILHADLLPGGLAHVAAIEIGRRLAARGMLDRSEEAVFLEHQELRAALFADSPNDLRPIIARRRAERAWTTLHPGPPTYGKDPGSPRDLRGMPSALGRVLGAMTWYHSELGGTDPSRPDRATRDDAADAGLHGLPGAPGRYSGSVRVIGSEREFERLRPGDVLVCPTTSPAWSVLFVRAGALVTNFGGVLSHAAIIARE